MPQHYQSQLATILLSLACWLTPGTASAHGFTVEAKSQDGKLRVVAGYDTGEPAEGAAVTVVAASSEVVAAGLTDATGVWVGPLPAAGKYWVRVDDGVGHGGRVSIVVNDSGEVPATPKPWPRWAGITVGLIGIAALTLGLKWWRRRGRGRVGGGLPATGQPARASGEEMAPPRPPNAL